MIAFLVRRSLWALLTLWFVVSATFVILHVLPADPARAIVGPHGSPETIARLRRSLRLDRPLPEQYVHYVARLARGDLGESFRLRMPVARLLADHVGPTVELALATVFLQVVLGVPLGVIGAVRRNRAADYVQQGVALVGQSAPTFFIGPLLVFVLAYGAGLFPISEHGQPGLDRLWHLALPALTLAVTGTAYYSRLVRGELVEVLSEDYVRTARAKGLGPGTVTLKHALRNALVPVVTLIGLDLGTLLGGAIVTESIFEWPGLGREAVLAVLNLDLPVVLGVVLVAAVAILVVNLAVDLVYAALDPRVRIA